MAQDSPSNNCTMPQPLTPTPIQRGADDSWRDFHKRGSSSAGEAIQNDPRKNPMVPAKP